MTERAARLACVALIVVVMVGGIGATTPSASAQPTDTVAQTGINPDDVSMRIELRPNGDAVWAIDYRVQLDSNETTDAFLSLREDIGANESRYTSQFRNRMASTAATAENATGREMTIRNVSVTATRQQLPQDYGVVTYTFVWTNFSVVDSGTLRAGDALAGLFLDSETSLQFAWPEGYALESVQPEPTDTRRGSRIVVWGGPLEFGPSEPSLTVSEEAAPATAGSAPTTTPADAGLLGSSPGLVVALVLALIVAVAGGYLYWRRDRSPAPGIVATRGGPEAAAAASTVGNADSPDASEDEPAATSGDSGETPATTAGSAVATDSEAADADEDDSTAASGPDTLPWENELLSNQERVLALVEHKGGRMKQQEVAQTLDWTDAKTSQVVRKMRDAGELDAFRLGRENVLVLPDEGLEPGDDD
ncbi:MAG: hypothetical protein ABEI27_04120 [Halobellus sp.]|uniref:DUF7345 domain-containing protein n=1 Tax=Halobellus sp. TaxID=1979212 RepID=UPI0035D4927E